MEGYITLRFSPAIDDNNKSGIGCHTTVQLEHVSRSDKAAVIVAAMDALNYDDFDLGFLMYVLKQKEQMEVSRIIDSDEFIRSVMRGTIEEALNDKD